MKRLMRMQTTEIAFETESGARSHPGDKPFLGSGVKTGPTRPLAGVDRDVPPEPTVPYERIRWALFLAASLALHAGMLAAFQRKAPPLASVGVQSISVEIMRADKLSALAREPSDSVLTINSAAAQGEHPLSVEPEATYQEIKVAEVASAAVTIRAPATVGIEPTVPGLPGHGQAVATAEIIETKQVEAKVAEPKLTIKSVGAQTDRPATVRPTSARAAGAPAPIAAEPITPALPQLGQAVAAGRRSRRWRRRYRLRRRSPSQRQRRSRFSTRWSPRLMPCTGIRFIRVKR